MSSGTPPRNDPMQMMRDAYAQGIERWSKAMEEIVGSEDFASASGQLLALYAQQQQSMRAASRVAAESIQMPTTEDLAEVAQLVINVERKVEEIADQSADVVTRLSAIETRLGGATAADVIPARLDAIEKRLAELAASAAVVQGLHERLGRIEEAVGELARRPAAPAVAPVREPAGAPASVPTSGGTPVSSVAKQPAAKQPAAKKPAARKPAARKPAAKKPAAKKPADAASTGATGTPAGRRTPPSGG